MCNLKTTQMNVQCSLIRELMIYEIELGHNVTKATKNICCMKDEGAVDHSTVNRWFKKFCLGCKKIDDRAKSVRSKNVDSEPLLRQIRWVALREYQANSVSHGPVRFVTYMISAKASGAAELCLTLWKYCKTFDSKIRRVVIRYFKTSTPKNKLLVRFELMLYVLIQFLHLNQDVAQSHFFRQSKAGLNLEFFFSETGCFTKS